MRKMILILCLIPVFAFGQLNKQAEGLKEQYSQIYDAIRHEAVKKWDTDYKMSVYEINQQSIKLMDLMYLSRSTAFDYTIFLQAVGKWLDNDESTYNEMVFGNIKGLKDIRKIYDLIFSLRCDWSMVKYEYDNQIKAKQSL